MNDILPLRVYMNSDGDFGIIHVHYQGSDILATKLDFNQVQTIINKSMETYPEGVTIDTFEVRKNVETIILDHGYKANF